MKRLISTFAILAIVTTMFSGITLAAGDAKIVLNNDYVIYESGFVQVSGRIVDENTNATITSADTIVSLNNGVTEYSTDEITRGRFTLVFQADIGNYTVNADSFDGWSVDGADLRVVPELTLDSSSSLNFSFPVTGQTTVQGVFDNQDGDDFSTVQIGYVDEADNTMLGGAKATASYKDSDAFGFLFNGNVLDDTGKIGIFVDGVLALEGEVSPDELNASMTPNEVPINLGTQPVTFGFDLSSTYVDDEYMEDGYSLRYSIIDPDDADKVNNSLLVGDTSSPFNNSNDQKVTVDLSCNSWETGVYEVVLNLVNDSSVTIATKTLELNVEEPDGYTLIGWSLDEVSVGDIKFSLPDSTDLVGDSADYPNISSNNIDQQIQVKDEDGYDMRFFVIEVEGAGVDETFTNYGDNKVDGDMHILTPTETGEMDIRIKVYESDSSTNPVDTFNKTLVITGYNVSITPEQVQADSNTDIVVNISDEDGNPINNASVYINGIRVVNGSVANIQNGRYIYENDSEGFFETVGGLDVEVRGWLHDEYLTISFEDAIEVVGEEIYSVTSSKESLVNGFEDTFHITTKEGSEIVFPDKIERINVDKDGNLSAPETLTGRGYQDLDDDDVREAIELRITPNNTQEAVIIRTSTDEGKKMGEVSIEVTGPEVEMFDSEKATENFEQRFEFKAIDPRNNDELDSYVYFSANKEYIDYTLEDKNGSSISVNSSGVSGSRRPDSNDEYIFNVFVNDVDWDKAEEDEQDLYISVYADTAGDDIKLFDIPVGKANLISDPEEVIVGSQARSFTFTYTDADGNPLEGYELYIDDEVIGETDEDGNAVYSTQATGLSINVTAETDDSDDDDSDISNPSSDNEDTIYTEYKIKAVADTQGPVATAPATVNQDSVVITIEDNGSVNKAMINKEPVDIFFPMPKVTEIYTGLKMGDNRIVVEAVDMNNNYRKTELIVTYTTQTTPGPGEVQLTVGQSTDYGIPELTNGTTMVPARFVEELGVTFEFDAQTKTATYQYGDNTVSVTNNRSTAIVNGTQVLMTEPAYINEQGRFMVPLRMVGEELGFTVTWISNSQPITISK